MSIRIMAAAWKQPLPATRKIVLLALADNANDQGECYPSISTIAEKSSLAERTVFKCIDDLEADGYLSKILRAGRSTIYRITDPCTWDTPAPDSPHPAPDSPQPLHVVHPTPASDAPITIRESPGEPSINQKARKHAGVDWIADLESRKVDRDVAESWLKVRKTKRAEVTAIAIDGVEREAKKAGMSLNVALRICCERGWSSFRADWERGTSASRRRPVSEEFDTVDYGIGGAV
jgi:hypothetical protein